MGRHRQLCAEVGFDPALRRDEQTGKVLADAQCPAGLVMDTAKGKCAKPEVRQKAVVLGNASGSPAEQAKAHYINGARLFDHDRFDEAIKEFEGAQQAKQDPAYFYNIGMCYRLKGDRPQALEYFKKYLTAVPDSPVKERIEKYMR